MIYLMWFYLAEELSKSTATALGGG